MNKEKHILWYAGEKRNYGTAFTVESKLLEKSCRVKENKQKNVIYENKG